MLLRLYDKKENKVIYHDNLIWIEFTYQDYNSKTTWLHIYPLNEKDFYIEINPKQVEFQIVGD